MSTVPDPDEVLEFCVRVLGAGTAAAEAARETLDSGATVRVDLLGAASRACRARVASGDPPDVAPRGDQEGLGAAVARELAAATARLPERQREALALSELSRLSHAQIGSVMGIGAPALALLLARARLGFRDARRGAAPAAAQCHDRERSLRALAWRQDGEPLPEGDGDWLEDHLSVCEHCQRAHAAMLEASVCYRAWPVATPAATEP